MTDDLINVYGISKKLMPLVHLPIQSGSNKVLKLMNRKHLIRDYMKIYEKLKSINPKIEFSSDFIIGYPGENEEDFKAKVATIKESYFGAKKEASSDIDDVAVGESTENVDLSKSMAAYTAAITKTKDIKLSK